MNREEVIKWLKSLKVEIGKSEYGALWHYAEAIDMATEALQVEPKTGKWVREKRFYKSEYGRDFEYFIEQCSECWVRRRIGWQGVAFCPNCGAKMEK